MSAAIAFTIVLAYDTPPNIGLDANPGLPVVGSTG